MEPKTTKKKKKAKKTSTDFSARINANFIQPETLSSLSSSI